MPTSEKLASHVYYSFGHRVLEDLVISQKLSNRMWMEFWVVSLVLERQQAIFISVCMHLVNVCVVLKPTSVYFLTSGLSHKALCTSH